MIYFLFIILFIATFLAGIVNTFPVILVCLLCFTIVTRNALPFIMAFVTGIFFDAFSIHPLGGTSMFLLGFVFLVMLYQRKYEIYSYQFVMIISFMGIVLHVWIFAYPEKISLSLAGVVLSGVLFAIVKSPQPPLSRGR